MLHKVPIFRIFPYNNLFLQPVCELPSQPFMMSQRPRSLSQVNERSHTQLLVLPKDTKRGPYIKMDRASSLTRGPTQKCPKPAFCCRPAAKHGCKWLHPHNQIWNLPVSKWTRKVKMPLTMKPWISGLLKGYSQTNGWRRYDSVHLYIQSFFFGWFTPCTLTQIASFVAGGWKQKGWKGEQYVIFQCNFIHSLLYTCRPCYAWQKWRLWLQRWWKHLQKWLFNCCSLTAGVFRHEGNSLPLYQL